MANSIKQSAGGLALQITQPARDAELVVEDTEGNATRRAEVYVYGFDDLLLLVDSETVAVSHRTELVTAAAQDTGSIHRGGLAKLRSQATATKSNFPAVRMPGSDSVTPPQSASGMACL